MDRKEIVIHRAGNPTRLPENIYDNAKLNIGSTWSPGGSTARPLDLKEEGKVMPNIVGVAKGESNYKLLIDEYYKNLTVRVPHDGLRLNITVDEDGTPENPEEYLKYKHALQHPQVANTKEEADADDTYRFYILDESKQEDKKYESMQVRKEAYRYLIELAADEQKADYVLTVLEGEQNKVHDTSLSPKKKEMRLQTYFDNNAAKFLEVAKDESLEIMAILRAALNKGFVTREGNAIVMEGHGPLGVTMKEAIIALQDNSNSDLLNIIRARLDTFKEPKKEKPKSKTKTKSKSKSKSSSSDSGTNASGSKAAASED